MLVRTAVLEARELPLNDPGWIASESLTSLLSTLILLLNLQEAVCVRRFSRRVGDNSARISEVRKPPAQLAGACHTRRYCCAPDQAGVTFYCPRLSLDASPTTHFRNRSSAHRSFLLLQLESISRVLYFLLAPADSDKAESC